MADKGYCSFAETLAVQGLAATFRLLTKTENEAAFGCCSMRLDSPHPAIQEGALVALLGRRSPAGGREILRRLPTHEPAGENHS